MSQLLQRLCNGIICSSVCPVAIGTATHLDRATGLSFAQSEFLNRITGQLTPFRYFESFFRRE